MHIILVTWGVRSGGSKLRLSPEKFSKTPSQTTTEYSGICLSHRAPQVSQIGRITLLYQHGDRDGHDTPSQWRKIEYVGCACNPRYGEKPK
jgi:hypothetical protein